MSAENMGGNPELEEDKKQIESGCEYLGFEENKETINNPKNMIDLLKKEGEKIMCYISDNLKSDKKFILAAIKTIGGKALKYAGKDLLRNYSVVFDAIRSYPKAIQWADKEWMIDPKYEYETTPLAIDAIRENQKIYDLLPKEVQEREIIKEEMYKRYNMPKEEKVEDLSDIPRRETMETPASSIGKFIEKIRSVLNYIF